MLRAFLRMLVPNPVDVDDLLQEVGVQVLSDLDSPVPADKFAAWARAIARNLVLRHRRSHARSPIILSAAYVEAVDRAFAEAEERETEERWNARRHALAECLTGLNERSRELLHERYVENARSNDMSRSFRRSPVAVRKALMKLRRALQKCIARRLGETTAETVS